MTIRELVSELLDHEMENEVEIVIKTDNPDEHRDFIIKESVYHGESYLLIELSGSTLVSTKRLEELDDLESDSE